MVRKRAITLAVAFSAVLAAAATIDKRISGGEGAKEGSLLDRTTVVTAAHCLVKKAALSVRAGSLNKDTGGVVAEVKSTLVHPEYFKRNNDIAILKLSTPIEESKTISYAKLPAEGSGPVIGSTAVAAGWGLAWGGHLAHKLRKVATPIHAPEDCLNSYRQNPEFISHLDTKVCAGEKGKDKDPRLGDSGGPLIDQETGQLIGVTSFGSAGPSPRSYYTKVDRYIPFIISGIEPRGLTG